MDTRAKAGKQRKGATASRRSGVASTTGRTAATARIPSERAPTHPGTMLREEFLEPLGMSQVELATWIGASYPRINELIHGKRGITPDTALRLEQAFGMDAQFWLNLQLVWDLHHARHSRSAGDIARIKRHPALRSRQVADSR
jgi:antitoxin HigA-1